ncbi:MAG TPA: SAM-dependent methyltransferase [Steroidobacteraceae bacterium]|jgi:SAM-dependent MidA family methyltransferase|nr:SAM-dependent methyltransferase [Steroidobacteraceae bacterium]
MLPPLTAEEKRHSRAVRELIRGEITARGGWMSFERYMELALYAPGLGYYSAGSTKLGAAGDFVTAPEVSALFARCLARQCAEVLGRTGGEILELGAGTGRLAADLLTALAADDRLPERYAILEVSADLSARQRERLAALPADLARRVVWLESLPATKLTGVVLANEVLDALPVRRVRVEEASVCELGVALDAAGEFTERATAADATLAEAYCGLTSGLAAALPPGYTSELCLRLEPWIASLADCLGEGVLLAFDYGLPRRHYYHPQRTTGTLRCHFRHRAHEDPYLNVGVQDITAWVDFTRVAEAAGAADLTVAGFATQTAFLLGCGLEEFVAGAADSRERARLAGEARRLVMPEEMGEAFKVMALTRAADAPLRGFALQDLRHQL